MLQFGSEKLHFIRRPWLPVLAKRVDRENESTFWKMRKQVDRIKFNSIEAYLSLLLNWKKVSQDYLN